MARVTLTAGELQPDGLPPVCAVCGEYADRDEPTHVTWSPMLIFLGLSFPGVFFGVCVALAFAFVVNCLAGKFRVRLPVCDAHRGRETRRKWLVVGLAASTWVSLGVGVWAIQFPSDVVAIVVVFGTPACLVAAFVAAIYFENSGVRAVVALPDDVTLEGVCPEFVAAVENARLGGE